MENDLKVNATAAYIMFLVHLHPSNVTSRYSSLVIKGFSFVSYRLKATFSALPTFTCDPSFESLFPCF